MLARPHIFPALLFAAAEIVSGGAERAWGGAWLLAPGEGRAIVYSVFSESSQAFDFRGQLICEPQYRKFELGTYIEYGVTDWLTLSISPAYDRIHGHPFDPLLPSLKVPPGRMYRGGGESGAAARIRLYQTENTVLSFQAGLQTRGASLAGPMSPFELRRAPSLELRTAAGTTATIFGKESFIDAEAAYRFYAKQPGEWRFDLTFGVRPVPGMLLMLQNFVSFTKAPPIFPDWVKTNGVSKYDRSWSDKLQPSIVFDITPQWSIQAGSFFTVAGRNAGREFGPLIGVWYRF